MTDRTHPDSGRIVTSGAADLRATFSEMLVDLPNTEPYTLFKAGFDAALAAGQATAAQQGAYAAPPDERAAFEAQFPVPGGVHWDGTEYVVKDSHVTSYRCNRFEGQWEAWKARASHGQAPAGATEPTEQQILEAAFAPAQPVAEPSRFGSPELQAMIIARCVEKDRADSVQEDAARYRLLRRGQHWSVIDGIGNDLRAEALDADVDAARKQGANHD